jgi:hypothetical protein
VQEEKKRADAAAAKLQAMTADMRTRFGASEYTRRAQSIAYRVSQGISIYGTSRD